MDWFKFGDVDTRNFDIYIFDMNTDNAPAQLVDEITIPGRNGSLFMQNHYFENVEHRYVGVIYQNAAENLKWFRNEIMRNSGYQRLEDSIHNEEFYQARYIGGLDPKITPDRKMVKFVIEFSRKPQRFLKDGEREIILSGAQTFENPTPFPAKPLIRVTGSGTLTLGTKTVTIASNSKPYIYIDSEMMDCYYSSDNCNSLVTFSDDNFPVFESGKSTLSYSGVSNVRVTPRWWAI